MVCLSSHVRFVRTDSLKGEPVTIGDAQETIMKRERIASRIQFHLQTDLDKFLDYASERYDATDKRHPSNITVVVLSFCSEPLSIFCWLHFSSNSCSLVLPVSLCPQTDSGNTTRTLEPQSTAMLCRVPPRHDSNSRYTSFICSPTPDPSRSSSSDRLITV